MRNWIWKAAGAAILLIAAGGMGWTEIREGRVRVAELRALVKLIRFIRENIERLSKPLGEIFAEYADPLLESSGFLPTARREGMERAAHSVRWHLSEEERAILYSFAAALGKGYREEQAELCRMTESRLSDAERELRESAPGRERLWRSIPVLMALSAILLFL